MPISLRLLAFAKPAFGVLKLIRFEIRASRRVRRVARTEQVVLVVKLAQWLPLRLVRDAANDR
jgi:hypothetical protein